MRNLLFITLVAAFLLSVGAASAQSLAKGPDGPVLIPATDVVVYDDKHVNQQAMVRGRKVPVTAPQVLERDLGRINWSVLQGLEQDQRLYPSDLTEFCRDVDNMSTDCDHPAGLMAHQLPHRFVYWLNQYTWEHPAQESVQDG